MVYKGIAGFRGIAAGKDKVRQKFDENKTKMFDAYIMTLEDSESGNAAI